jgi:hypothetical protein
VVQGNCRGSRDRTSPRLSSGLVEGAQVAGRAEGVGVVVAESSAVPGEGVFVHFAGGLVLAEGGQVDGEAVGGAEGVGVVVAEAPAGPGEGVFVETGGVRTAKAMGLGNLHSKSWQVNKGWVIAADLTAWTRLLDFGDDEDMREADPDTLRYRVWAHPCPARSATPASAS